MRQARREIAGSSVLEQQRKQRGPLRYGVKSRRERGSVVVEPDVVETSDD